MKRQGIAFKMEQCASGNDDDNLSGKVSPYVSHMFCT